MDVCHFIGNYGYVQIYHGRENEKFWYHFNGLLAIYFFQKNDVLPFFIQSYFDMKYVYKFRWYIVVYAVQFQYIYSENIDINYMDVDDKK